MNEVAVPRFGIVPRTMDEAMRFAEFMATAKLVPVPLQGSPADCFLVIQLAMRWDMDPFAVAQECSIIRGRIMHSGKLVAAVINSRGNLQNRLSYNYHGDGDLRTVTVSGRLQGEIEPRTVDVVFKNARTANEWWAKQPDQQLMYHGARVWGRRHTPELMLGVQSPEEFEPEPLRASAKLPPRPAPNVLLHNLETGEIEDPSPVLSPDMTREGAPGSSETEDTTPPNQSEPGVALAFRLAARQEARKGKIAFRDFYRNCDPQEQALLAGEMKPELDKILANADEDHTQERAAYAAGQDAKSAGVRRAAMPGEYRENSKLEGCWIAGWNGDEFPMV